jgi:hypothetical protein
MRLNRSSAAHEHQFTGRRSPGSAKVDRPLRTAQSLRRKALLEREARRQVVEFLDDDEPLDNPHAAA